ncbi:hypothetical protein BpHYR1_052035 [Brachionus plicatilis]|uniref:Uncharacterized protein n=1 Tax=Brachionus plicatilis TaxID=10195 RepID=A0A3M7PZ19_BRAPC|nr:hypothetical protein BpHYR1_052035 [Brachionus plicatilis]
MKIYSKTSSLHISHRKSKIEKAINYEKEINLENKICLGRNPTPPNEYKILSIMKLFVLNSSDSP